MTNCFLFKPIEEEEKEEEVEDALILSRQKRNFDYCFSTSSVSSTSSTSSTSPHTNSTTTTCIPIFWPVVCVFLFKVILMLPKPPPTEIPTTVVVLPPPGFAPSEDPQPGQPGGGDPPSANPEAAALAPPGTVPVAVFPPFIRNPINPTLCVTFSELTASEQRYNSNEYGRKKARIAEIQSTSKARL